MTSNRSRLIVLLAAVGVTPLWGKEPDQPALSSQEALRKATVSGKYEMLLRQIRVPADAEKYGEFRDLGARNDQAYAGFTDLPRGHWVYVQPSWYIWRDRTTDQKPPKAAWCVAQACGAPDTHQAGDIVTAWAQASSSGGMEWLLLEYENPVLPSAVWVHETYNPGTLVRVTAFKMDGTEVDIWKGKDPTAPGSQIGMSKVDVKAAFKTKRIKIYLDRTLAPGWNEIDAVGLRDSDGKIQWAKAAHGSSDYSIGIAPPAPPPVVPAPMPAPAPAPMAPPPVAVPFPGKPMPPVAPPAPPPMPKPSPEDRVKQLEQENADLKAQIVELKRNLELRKQGLLPRDR